LTVLNSAQSNYSGATSTVGPESSNAEEVGAGNGYGPSVRNIVDRRPVGGLGRGLAGILDQSPKGEVDTGDVGGAGLGLLVGQQSSSRAATVQAFVVETALAAVADAFGADGVVMTSRERPDRDDVPGAQTDSPSLSMRLPPSWGPSSPALFAVYGNLWGMLNSERHHCSSCGQIDQPLAYRQEKVDSYWAWFCRIDDQSASVASALVRSTPFDEEESDALARSMRSIASAMSPVVGRSPGDRKQNLPIATNVSVSPNPDSEDPTVAITAEVTVRNTSPAAPGRSVHVAGISSLGAVRRSRGSLASLTATGRGPDIETAVARAAANACHPQCTIRFAGSSDLDGNTISVVIVSDATGGPRLGLAVRPVGDYSGVAEAVFLAASPGGIPSLG
jgi:hypothetical protein